MNHALDAETVLWPVVEEHLDEAEFMFELRQACLDAPDDCLADLEEGPEARLRAHVDGLVVGGAVVAAQLLQPTLADPEQLPCRVTVAALAHLADLGDGVASILRAIDESEHEGHWGALALALGFDDDPRVSQALLDSLAAAPAHGVAARLTALTARGLALGPGLLAHLRSPDRHVLRAAAAQARLYLDRDLLQVLGPLAQAEDLELRRRSLDAALCHQVPGAWEALRYWAFTPDPSPWRRHALTRVALLGDAGAHQQLLTLLEQPALRADVLWAAGFCGRVAAVDAVMPLLAEDELGPLAAEVVVSIAGLPADADGYWRPRARSDDPEDTLPPLELDDLEAELEPTPEQALPLPDPERIAAWWAQQRPRFDPSVRHLYGRVLDHQALLVGLRDGPMRRRHELAFEVAVRSGGRIHLDTRGPVARQRAGLAALAAAALGYQQGLAGR